MTSPSARARGLRPLIRRHPVATYYVLACVLSWSLTALVNVSLAFGLLALFGPAIAAFIAALLADGADGTRRLRERVTHVRIGPRWYAAALGLPVIASAIGLGLYIVAGNPAPALLGAVTAAEILIFFLVIGEEIGWRGYMLEQLTRRWSPIVATAIVALAWAAWHLPLYLVPGMPSDGQPVVAFVAWVIPVSFLLSWLYLGTRSVVAATFMHGAANVALPLLLPGMSFAQRLIFSAVGFALVAGAVVALAWQRFTAPSDAESEAIAEPSPATPT